MIRATLFAALIAAAPSAAFAQVGPNPKVNGSLDPTVGASTDAATAPDDVKVGAEATVESPASAAREVDPAEPATSVDKPADAPAARDKQTPAPPTTAKKPR